MIPTPSGQWSGSSRLKASACDQCLRVECFIRAQLARCGPVLGNCPDITATKGLDIV